MCLVGTSPLLLELPKIQDIANPMYLFAQKTFIPNLTFEETQEMVKTLGYFMGLEFPPELVAELFAEYGGHPFFVRQVCSKVHQISSTSRPIQVSQNVLEKAQADFGGQLQVYLRDIFGNLEAVYPDEFDLLKAVIREDVSEISEFGREAPELIDHLIGYGIVAKKGDDFDICFGAIREALRAVLVPDTKHDRWAEISSRRNILESEIRLMIYHWSLSVSSIEWSDVIEENLTQKRRDALPTYEPRLLFSKTKSPLYWSDLMLLLKDTRVLQFLDDQRSLLAQHLSTINKYRNDAHAKEVGDEEMVEIRSAFDYLEDEFLQP